MKKIRQILFIFFLLIIYIYVAYITLLPNNIIIFDGEEPNINTIFGIGIQKEDNINENIYDTETMQASKNLTENKVSSIGKTTLSINLFDEIPLKQVEVNVIKKTKVIPLGNAIGLKLYTKGVMVVGMSEIQGEDNKNYKPYENTGIKEGDMIIAVNNSNINNIDELINKVNKSNGEKIELKYIRDERTITTSITPTKTVDNEYKLGLWVRDAGAGVGTATFYEPETQNFCALGHGITDVDTGDIIDIKAGDLVKTKILSITKGEKGKPGEIKGSIESEEKIGQIFKNTSLGIYGNISEKSKLLVNTDDAIDVALREEIQIGDAEIICQLDNGKKEKYKIEIHKIYTSNNYDNKSMIIKITDEKLIEKTGGIIQGMSGSPIIQNGKFIGAITHVLVNDPCSGYAVFADMMIKEMRAVD